MDDPNMTMEEYIKFDEEKARRHGRVFDWQTATYGKIRVDDDLCDLRSMEAEFPAIIIDDDFEPQDALQCKSQVSTPVNDEIDFRISFDESDDEDYTIICDNDSCFDDLEFFKDFENEFPAIIYNDAQTSKSDLLIEPILNHQHIVEFNLNDETSLFESDEKEHNVLYFNDLFPFNIIHLDDLKSEKDNDNNEVDTVQSSVDMALPPCEQRHRFLRYDGVRYSDADIADFEGRLARIYRREVRMLMEHRDDQGVSLFTSRAWRRLFDIRGPLVHELILEFCSTFRFGQAILDLDTSGALQFQLGGAKRRMSWREFILALGLYTAEEMQTVRFGAYWADSARQIPDKGDLRDYWIGISTAGDFLSTTPSYTTIRDPILRLCHRLIACSVAGGSQAPEKVTVTDLFYLRGMDIDSVNAPYLLARYLRLFAAGRKSGAHISGGQFVARLAEHFGLLTVEILGGLTVIALELPIINMAELVRLQICVHLDDTWAWVAMGPERQPDASAGAPAVDEDAPAVDEGDQAIPAPMQAPQQPPPPQLLLGLCPIDWGDLRRRHSMGLSEGAHLGHSIDAPDRGLARPAPPQHSRTHSSQTHDSSYLYLLIKPGSKFSTIVHEYVTEPSRIFTLDAKIGKKDGIRREAEEKSNLKTSLMRDVNSNSLSIPSLRPCMCASAALLEMTKVIKGEFEKIKDVKVEGVQLTCDASLEVFNNEVRRLSRMDDDIFTYEVEVANILCDSKMDDDSEQEADDDMGYDPSDIYWIRGYDEVELTDEESSDDEDDISKVFRIDTNIFDYETPLCSEFKEFNYLLEVDPDLLTKDIIGFKTYEDYKDNYIYEWNKDNYEWYEALEDSELKDEALRNKAIMEGSIKENDDESRYEQKRQWNTYTNYNDAYEINHEHNESEELCEVHEQPVCNIRRYMMIKYLFNDDEEYVAVKEDEYDDLTVTRKEACRAYQEIF
ncbi:hypothetical protein Tco_0796889 [Tanacetum coccineum]